MRAPRAAPPHRRDASRRHPANSRIRMTGTFGVLHLTLQPGGYRWRFVHAAGAPFTDHGSGTCR